MAEYSQRILQTWGTGRLACLFGTIVLNKEEGLEEDPQLRIIVQILRERPFNKRRHLHWMYSRDIRTALKSERYESVRALERVRDYFQAHVLD
ncbi:MAG: hypothetical protein KJ718_00905 [Nanoarchaeota archaeon]|nr:hypothetical protein [Nanoarchaeota archaeon]MBU1051097.1 hypothetical protein [Nanoarchaeota archaeon]